jgi:AraC-like DNA-binding protein
VTVAARSAKNVTAAASSGYRDVRGKSPATAGSYLFEVDEEIVTGWHFHDLHQLEYAFEGVAQVETATARYLLPPQQAIWIPAGVEHSTTLTRVRTMSVFFDPSRHVNAQDHVRVLPATSLIREMILHAGCWPISGGWSDDRADRFFDTLVDLVEDLLDHELPLWLPTGRDPLVVAAMAVTQEQLADVGFADVCRVVGASERSLRRAFAEDAGIPWRQYLLQSRLLRAMALLADPGPTVLAVATGVGFDSTSGFARAFRAYTGETPSAYRRRVLARDSHTERPARGQLGGRSPGKA